MQAIAPRYPCLPEDRALIDQWYVVAGEAPPPENVLCPYGVFNFHFHIITYWNKYYNLLYYVFEMRQ